MVAALAACGGGSRAPRTPAPLAPKDVAQRLHLEMNEMAAIARRTREDCPRMAAELRELFARMRVSVDEAKRMGDDAALSRQLTTELRSYDDVDRGLADAIFVHLRACKDHHAVRDVMTTMPIVPIP